MDKKPKNKRPMRLIILSAVILGIIGVVAWEIYINTRNSSGEYFTIEYEAAQRSDFYINESNIFYCDKNGVRLVDEKGRQKWEDKFSTLSPVLCGDKNILAVLEKTGTVASIYNERGLIYRADMGVAPITYAVNGKGCFAAVIKDNNNYKLTYYNVEGKSETLGEFSSDKGVPMSVDISDDSRIIAVGFMDISGMDITGVVSFFYTDVEEANSTAESDGLFCTEVSKKNMPVMLRFTNDNRCYALMNGGLMFIEPESTAENKKTQEVVFENAIKYACLNGDGTFAVALGEGSVNASGALVGNTVLWYDGKGNKVNEITVDKNITGLFAGKGCTVIAQDRTFEAVSTKGNSIWTYNALGDTRKVLPYEGNSKMLTVGTARAMLSKAGKNAELKNTDPVAEGETEISEDNTENTENISEIATAEAVEAKTAENITESEPETDSENKTESEAEPVSEAEEPQENNED